jgi:chromosome partitioning protein
MASYAEPDKDRLADLLPLLAERHALLIADTAGFGNLAATICMVGADAILIPVSPGEGDVVEARKTVGFIEGLARTARRPIPAAVVANRIRRGTTLSRHTLAEIEALSLPRLQTALSEAVAYGELGFSGALPLVGAAAAEIAALVAELRGQGWLPAESTT